MFVGSFMIIRKSLSRLYVTLLLLFTSTTIGTVGYMLIENYSFLEAIYQTVITLSTVGFEEVKPLSNTGMVFTTLFIIFNLGVFAFVISSLTSYLFEGELNRVFHFYLTTRELMRLKDHVIVCGFGRNGRKAAEELIAAKRDFIVIDSDGDMGSQLSPEDRKKIKMISGDATLDEVLMNSGVERASTIITTLPSDADNVFISMAAKEINPAINVIARASDENSLSKLYRSGASHVVMPDNLGGLHMARLVTKPYVIEFLDLLNGLDTEFALEEFDYEEFKDEFRNEKLLDIGVRERSGATIIAYKEKGHNFIFNPPSDVEIAPNDIFILLGNHEHLAKFKEIFIE
jgi:voltage-gated potassium channel